MSKIVEVKRYGPQLEGEYWWQAYDVEGTPVVAFWTELRNPREELLDLAAAALADERDELAIPEFDRVLDPTGIDVHEAYESAADLG